MSEKLVAHAVLGLAVSSALLAAVGCSGTPGQDPVAVSVAQTTSADTQGTAYGVDDAPHAASGVADPGVRGGAPGVGGHLANMNDNEIALYNEGIVRASEVEATCNGCQDYPAGAPIPANAAPDATNSSGLGARFNNNQCMGTCHAQPAFGGTSPAVNPSFSVATAKGATNVVPWFETIDGPTREVRFLFNADGSRDGGVHQKFSTRGRSDVSSACTLGQPDFSDHDNMSFRIPTPVFGLGIVDALFDKEILGVAAQNAQRKTELGIHGAANHDGNTGTITKFGWKAQNKSLFMFSGEAYTVEMGVTNEMFPTQKVEDDSCGLGAHPNDTTNTGNGTDPLDPKDNFNQPVNVMADWMLFAIFMKFTAPPVPAPMDASATHGQQVFEQIGCNECHAETLQAKSGSVGANTSAINGQTIHPYSDFLVHHMGATLADNVIQGGAGPDQFRSAPLWGVGQRIFFLHDGRASSLVDAIMAHYSRPTAPHGNTPAYPASEANQVVRNFSNLDAQSQQDLVNFLRSL